MSDPAKYRTREEVNKIREEQRSDRDVARKRIIERRHHASEDELKKIEKGVRDMVTEAAEFARRAGTGSGRALDRHLPVRPADDARTSRRQIRECASHALSQLERPLPGQHRSAPDRQEPSQTMPIEHPDAGALAHDGRGHAGQVAEEGGRYRPARRRDRRDRDRQGDHGGRGDRRGIARPHPGSRGDRERQGQHADRDAQRRRRGRRRRSAAGRRGAGENAEDEVEAAEAESAPKRSRRRSRRPPRRPSRRRRSRPKPTSPPAPRW